MKKELVLGVGLAVAAFAMPAVSSAQGPAYTLPPYPTVAQLTAAVHAESAYIAKHPAFFYAQGNCPARRNCQNLSPYYELEHDTADTEGEYLEGALKSAELGLKMDEGTLSLGLKEGWPDSVARMQQSRIAHDKKELDMLKADWEEFQQQLNAITP